MVIANTSAVFADDATYIVTSTAFPTDGHVNDYYYDLQADGTISHDYKAYEDNPVNSNNRGFYWLNGANGDAFGSESDVVEVDSLSLQNYISTGSNRIGAVTFYADAGDTIKVYYKANNSSTVVGISQEIDNKAISNALTSSTTSSNTSDILSLSYTATEAGVYYAGCTANKAQFYAVTTTAGGSSSGETSSASVTLTSDATDNTITYDGSTTVTATVTGADENVSISSVSWSSDSESVAKVSSDSTDSTTATVTGVAAGTAVITATVTLSDNSTCTGTITITVAESSSSGGDSGDTESTGDLTAYLYFAAAEDSGNVTATESIATNKEYWTAAKDSAFSGKLSFSAASSLKSASSYSASNISISNIGTYTINGCAEVSSNITINVPDGVKSATFYAIVSSSGSSKRTFTLTNNADESDTQTVDFTTAVAVSFSNLAAGNTYTISSSGTYRYYMLGLVTEAADTSSDDDNTYVYFGITEEQALNSSSYTISDKDGDLTLKDNTTVYTAVNFGDGSDDVDVSTLSSYDNFITAEDTEASNCIYVIAFILDTATVDLDTLSIAFTALDNSTGSDSDSTDGSSSTETSTETTTESSDANAEVQAAAETDADTESTDSEGTEIEALESIVMLTAESIDIGTAVESASEDTAAEESVSDGSETSDDTSSDDTSGDDGSSDDSSSDDSSSDDSSSVTE